MKARLLSIFILTILLSCQKNDKDEFNVELVAGEYTGNLIYWAPDINGEIGNSVTALTKLGGYKTIITKTGSTFNLSFDKSFIYTPPDMQVEIYTPLNATFVGITTSYGQVFSASLLPNYQNFPKNYFAIREDVHRAEYTLTVRSNNPDSIYFLTFSGIRIY